MKKYIDFDGVIVDTMPLVFEEWAKIPNYDSLSLEEKIMHAGKQNWRYILENARVIGDAITVLKQLDPKQSAILTKVNSLENEGAAKISYLRDRGVRQEIILVPFTVKKTDVVSAEHNMLIDDTIHNLDEWAASGGRSIYFNKDDSDIDPYQVRNTRYPKIKSLGNVKRYL